MRPSHNQRIQEALTESTSSSTKNTNILITFNRSFPENSGTPLIATRPTAFDSVACGGRIKEVV